jgi:hypothetical protein
LTVENRVTVYPALCDAVLLMRRAGVAPENLLTFGQLHRLDATLLKNTARRYPYPATIGRALSGILERFA